jgi:pimeloyl-ACP methyl ester carboxylesterase
MPTIEVNGVPYAYVDEGTGPLVLFGHGLLANKEMFRAQIDALRDRYRCVSIDWPAHGQSGWRASGFGFDDLVVDTVALLQALGQAPAVLVGLSQGAMVFMRLAYTHPELVRGLVLLDTTAGPENPDSLPAYEQLAVLIRDGDEPTRAQAVAAATMVLFGEPWRAARPDLLAHEQAVMLQISRDGGYLAARAVFDRDDVHDRVGAIATPTLVMTGEDDTATPPELGRRLAELIPGARFELVPRAGHHSPIENPAAVTAELELFLANLHGQGPE